MALERPTRVSSDLHKTYILSSIHSHRLAWNKKLVPPLKKQDESYLDISIPGMRRLCDPSYTTRQKIFWFLAILGCTIASVVQIWDRFAYYMNAPVTLEIVVKRNQSITFPSITLCPGTINFAFKESMIQALTDKFLSNPEYKNRASSIGNGDFNHFDFAKVNFSLDLLWKRCKLEPQHVSITTPCSTCNDDSKCSNGHSVYAVNISHMFSLWGICIVITPTKDMVHRGPDTYINLEIQEPSPFDKNSSPVENMIMPPPGAQPKLKKFKPHRDRISNKALQFFLHPKGIRYRHDSSFLVESLLRGFYTQVRFTIKEFHYSSAVGCKDMLEVKMCRSKRMDKLLDKVLNCSLPFLTKTSRPACRTISDSLAAFENASKIYTGPKVHLSSCGRPCTDIIYSLTTDVVYELNARERQTFVQFYYPDNVYERIEEHCSYTLTAFFSDLSANLGFFLGFCMLTLVEMAEAFFKKIKNLIKH